MSRIDERSERKQIAKWQEHVAECFSNERCLGGYPAEVCKLPAIQSHTIARRWLRPLARNSHIYAPTHNHFDLEKVDPTIGFPLVSINVASTLQLYCAQHDNKLFREIEATGFSPDARSAGLLHFRGVCRETLTKIGANVVSGSLPDDGPPEIQLLKIGQRIGLRDASIHYHHELRRVNSNDFSGLRYYICEFEKPLPFAVVGAFLPEIDFDGNLLADLADFATTPEPVGIACFSDNGVGYLALTWDVRGHFARALAASFHRLPPADKADAALTLGFEFIENVALSPEWWNSLPERDRLALIRRHRAAGTPTEERLPDALKRRSHVLSGIAPRAWHSNEGLFCVLR